MNTASLVLGVAIVLGLFALAQAILRGAHSIATGLSQTADAISDLRESQCHHTTAIVAGLLVGHRLGSASYDRVMDENMKLQREALYKAADVLLNDGPSDEKIRTSKAFKDLSEDFKSVVAHHDLFGHEAQTELVSLARDIVRQVFPMTRNAA